MNHLKLAHTIWKEHLKPGMTVVDATAGNGHDTLFLTREVLTKDAGWVHAFDIQENALERTKALLKDEPFKDRVTLHLASHETFPGLLEVDLIAYNLGYLPGGDKRITTLPHSTLKSCQNALKILRRGGLLSITMYPGHNQGLEEKGILLTWLQTLPLTQYTVYHHLTLNSPKSPSLVILKKLTPNYVDKI